MSTKGENGNGMGLWTVQHILKRHGGFIQVDSKPDQGTTFTLHWPRMCGNEALSTSSEHQVAQLVY